MHEPHSQPICTSAAFQFGGYNKVWTIRRGQIHAVLATGQKLLRVVCAPRSHGYGNLTTSVRHPTWMSSDRRWLSRLDHAEGLTFAETKTRGGANIGRENIRVVYALRVPGWSHGTFAIEKVNPCVRIVSQRPDVVDQGDLNNSFCNLRIGVALRRVRLLIQHQ